MYMLNIGKCLRIKSVQHNSEKRRKKQSKHKHTQMNIISRQKKPAIVNNVLHCYIRRYIHNI